MALSICSKCEWPRRQLWTYHNLPQLDEVTFGNWMLLKRCADCGKFWYEVPHEPYASFTFMTAWPYDVQTWLKIRDLDDSTTLHEWHDAVIREQYRSLPKEEIDAVEKWRDRTYRHYNPIDLGPDMPQPKQIRVSSDLDAIVNSLRGQ